MSMFGYQNCDVGFEYLMSWIWNFQNKIMMLEFDEYWLKMGSLGVFLRKPQVHLDIYCHGYVIFM